MKQRILFVIDSLRSGGAEKSLISLLSMLDVEQYEIDLLMFSPDGLYVTLLPEEINVLNVPDFMEEQRNNITYFLQHKRYRKLYIRFGTMLSLRNPIKKRRFHRAQITWKWMSKDVEKIDKTYDIAIAYSQGHPTYFVAKMVSARKKICWVNTDYKLAGYNKSFDKKFYKQYDSIVAVSEYNKDVFTQEMPNTQNKITVIYDLISPRLVKSMIQKSGGFQDGYEGMRLLTIGRLVDVKGYDIAIEACFKLKQAGFKFKWYAIGEGPLKNNLLNMIKKYELEDTFILLGTHKNPYVFLKDSDLYVQPSRYEGFGLAIAEARLLNIPVVATRFDSVYDQLTNKKNGLIVDVNAASLYNGIVELIRNQTLRDSIVNFLRTEKKGNVEEINKVYKLLS